MELVVVNFRAAGKARRTTFNGRDYLVAPMTLIVPGVVPGSEGPLLYPLEELARNYQAWNYMPIVVNHPLRNGRHVSAREPAILEESGVGFVFNASLDGRLRGEGWFDVERTRRVDGRVLDRLERGEPLELSTGLYVDEEAAPLGAVWNTPGGPRPYRAVARNYRPDHLAVLPDQRGACAVDDGCGVLVNAGKDQPPGGVTALPDVGGEDWGSYSREEILDLLTEAALESLDGPAGNAFDPNQPRDERGRFAGAGAGGALPHGERQAQRGGSVQHARDFVTKGGPATHAEVGALADHLARLTVAQLHDLRREHGLPAQGAWKQRKPELVQTLAGRLAAHRATLPTAAARELTTAVKGNPDFVESKNKPSDAVHAYTHEGTGFRATAHPDGRFHVWDTGLSHQGTYHTAAEAVAHAASPPAKSSPDYHQRTADVETAARQGAVADAATRRAAQAATPAPDAQAAARAAGQNLEALHEGSKPLIQAASKVIGSAGRERVRQAFASTRAASEDSRLATTAQEHGTAARRHRQAANDHGAAVEFMRAHSDTSNLAVSAMVGRHEEMVAAHRGAREHHLALADSDTVARERRLETDRPLASTYNAADLTPSYLVNARGDQPRVPAGQPGGGRFASVAEAGAAVEKASARVQKAQAALEKAKAALKVEKDGLVTAKAGLKEAQAREKAQSPRAKAAAAKAKEKAPVNVAAHVADIEKLSDRGVAGKHTGKYGRFEPEVKGVQEFRDEVDGHMAKLGKAVNKAQALEVARRLGHHVTSGTTKAGALKLVRDAVIDRRGTKLRTTV